MAPPPPQLSHVCVASTSMRCTPPRAASTNARTIVPTTSGGATALGAHFTKAVESPRTIHPLVWAALALSILLLALAAVPSETLVNARAEAIAYKRFEVAIAGTAALGTAFLMYLIS